MGKKSSKLNLHKRTARTDGKSSATKAKSRPQGQPSTKANSSNQGSLMRGEPHFYPSDAGTAETNFGIPVAKLGTQPNAIEQPRSMALHDVHTGGQSMLTRVPNKKPSMHTAEATAALAVVGAADEVVVEVPVESDGGSDEDNNIGAGGSSSGFDRGTASSPQNLRASVKSMGIDRQSFANWADTANVKSAVADQGTGTIQF
jgi:hypothetical protein